MKKNNFIILSFFSILFFACSKERVIDLNSLDSLSITPDQQWAVVKVPYVSFLENCDYSSTVLTHARGGDIFLVHGKNFVKKQSEVSTSKKYSKKIEEIEVWYKFEEGFLSSSLVDIYDTKLKAKSASEKILIKQ